MKITRKQLKRIIKEELSRVLTTEGAAGAFVQSTAQEKESSDEEKETSGSDRYDDRFIIPHEKKLQAYIKSAMAGSADVVAALKESFSSAPDLDWNTYTDGQMYQLLTTMLQISGDDTGNPSWGVKLVLGNGEKKPLQGIETWGIGGKEASAKLTDDKNIIWQAADYWESGKGAIPNLTQEDALKVAEDMGRKGWSTTLFKYDFADPRATRYDDAAIFKVIKR